MGILSTSKESDSTSSDDSERANAELQAFYVSILNSMQEGFLVLNAHGNVVHCNDMAAEIFGLTKSELLSQSADSVMAKAVYEDGTPIPLSIYRVSEYYEQVKRKLVSSLACHQRVRKCAGFAAMRCLSK